MAVNLAGKYAKELAQAFTQKSFVDGIACKDYEFTGVKNLKVYTAISQELNDYKRSGTNRYGEPKEAQDTVQDMIVEKDRSFSITVDKGNNAASVAKSCLTLCDPMNCSMNCRPASPSLSP